MDEILQGFKLIGEAFVKDVSIWWFLAPVFLLWIGMEIYFGQYKKEKLGWNSILANSISFTWINIAAFRVLFSDHLIDGGFWPRFLILFLFFLYGAFVMYIGFFHKLSSGLAAFLAGPTQVYFLSVASILWGQGGLAINKWIFLDLIIAYIIIALFFKLIRRNLGTLGEVEAITDGQDPL